MEVPFVIKAKELLIHVDLNYVHNDVGHSFIFLPNNDLTSSLYWINLKSCICYISCSTLLTTKFISFVLFCWRRCTVFPFTNRNAVIFLFFCSFCLPNLCTFATNPLLACFNSYVERLLDRISNGVLAEDRRAAIAELQSVVAESGAAQLAFGAMG